MKEVRYLSIFQASSAVWIFILLAYAAMQPCSHAELELFPLYVLRTVQYLCAPKKQIAGVGLETGRAPVGCGLWAVGCGGSLQDLRPCQMVKRRHQSKPAFVVVTGEKRPRSAGHKVDLLRMSYDDISTHSVISL